MIALVKLKEFINKVNDDLRIYKQVFLHFITTSINKFHNLAKTNFDLGMYHINHGNTIDAKLRFKLVKNLFGDFANIDYHLARCYIYENNTKKALNHLALDEPLAIFRRHIIENKEINYIPLQVIIEDYDYHANFENHYTTSLPIINSYISRIIELKEIVTFSRILDLGCGRGNFAIALEKTFTHPFTIDAIDSSSSMINHCKTLKNAEDITIYNNYYNSDYRKFQIAPDDKYDLVIANFSLHYSLNLTESLGHIIKFLKDKGVIFLTLYTSTESVSFDYDLQNFCFSEEFIKACIKESNLNIRGINNSTINETKNLVELILTRN